MVGRQLQAVIDSDHRVLRDRHQRIVGLIEILAGEEGLIGGNQRQFVLKGELDYRGFGSLVVARLPLQLDVEPVWKKGCECLETRNGPAGIAALQRDVYGARGTARQRDDPAGSFLLKPGELEDGALIVRAAEIHARDDANEARIAFLGRGN